MLHLCVRARWHMQIEIKQVRSQILGILMFQSGSAKGGW